jgi:hypothetical protein
MEGKAQLEGVAIIVLKIYASDRSSCSAGVYKNGWGNSFSPTLIHLMMCDVGGADNLLELVWPPRCLLKVESAKRCYVEGARKFPTRSQVWLNVYTLLLMPPVRSSCH